MTYIHTHLDNLRRPDMKPVYVLETDGHNFPTIHRFVDKQHTCETIAKWHGERADDVEKLLFGDEDIDLDFESQYYVIESPESLVRAVPL